ncbi:Serine--pyruvate aminotransferase, mitochondrial [Toxocara canis]|uniref:Serine--pyruvate aminotransferase, mitochondrial n=1 Tax=Toxocara canis TaxID=6265 RepID=A0A0B2VKZ9_TOXCA|nr:Serine--pyruvate aminotransferase, mitochondrial [Toxocara canis]
MVHMDQKVQKFKIFGKKVTSEPKHMLAAHIRGHLPRAAFSRATLVKRGSNMSAIKQPNCLLIEPNIPNRLLMGPGPSNMTAEIRRSQSQSLLGHLDPNFLKIMDDVKEGLRYAFQTNNALTFAISGTG